MSGVEVDAAAVGSQETVEAAVDNPRQVDVSSQTLQKKKNKPRKERDDKCVEPPVRPQPQIFAQDKEGKVTATEIVITGEKSSTFQVCNNKRVASRGGFYDTLARDALKLKTVCNDSVEITINKWEKDENPDNPNQTHPPVTRFSTERTFFANLPTSAPIRNNAPVNLPDPSALLLSSPSHRPRGISTARSLSKQKDQFCRRCDKRYKAEDNDTNPWTGCKHVDKAGNKCSTWVHTRCTGWMAENAFQVAAMPNWYCAKHRKNQFAANQGSAASSSGSKKGSAAKRSAPSKKSVTKRRK